MTKVCLLPRLSGIGGMVSFQAKMAAGLARHGIRVCYTLADTPYDAVLVIGGTRHLPGLWLARRHGIPIVQRLDGMNWLHRRRRTGWRHFVRSEYGNCLLALIRARLASRIVYQSRFAQGWWERMHGVTASPSSVIHNGVDLSIYTPDGPQTRPTDRARILMVEGTLGGGYEVGVETALRLVEQLRVAHSQSVELMIVGQVSPALQAQLMPRVDFPFQFAGPVDRECIPEIDRSAHLLYAADLNAACPNATIEALACGLPVIAFDTGALSELVTAEAGRVLPYGGNPWRLDAPDVAALGRAALEILTTQPRFRSAARARAEAAFGLDKMVVGYLEALLG